MTKLAKIFTVIVLFFSLCTQAQESNLVDSVRIKQGEILSKMDGNYVLKIGTVYLDTRKSYKDSLLSLPGTVVVSNGDKTLDVLFEKSFLVKADLLPYAKDYSLKGFNDMQIAKMNIDNNEFTLTVDEAEDDLYTVSIGIFDGIVPLPAAMKILSVSGLRSIYDPVSKRYVYVHGVYYNQQKAKEVTLKLANAGLFPDVLRYGKGILASVKPQDLYSFSELATFEAMKDNPAVISASDVVFRVQVGTFATAVPKEKFGEVEVLIFPVNSSTTKCFAGAFSTYREAYKYKVQLKKMGFKDAFIVVYKDGESKNVGEFLSQEEYRSIKAEFGE